MKKRKTMYAIVLMLLVAFSIFPAALAQEEEVDVEEEEIEIMVDSLGAEIRLLQLERAITRAALRGAEIVETVQEKDPETDVSELNSILDELELLIMDIQEVSREGTREEIAEQFTTIKTDSKALVKEFRDLAKTFLDASDRAAIAKELKTMNRQVLQDITKRILETKREFIAGRLSGVLEKMDISNPELVEQVESGAISIGEARQQVRANFRSLPIAQRRATVMKVKEVASKRAVFKSSTLRNIRARRVERRSGVAKRRSNRLQKRGNLAQVKGFEGRAERLEERSDSALKRGLRREIRSDRLTKRGNEK